MLTILSAQEQSARWVEQAMKCARLSVPELAERSGVPQMTIRNILHQVQKGGCRVDLLFRLLECCGFRVEVRLRRG